jgi:rhomboid protease GluP
MNLQELQYRIKNLSATEILIGLNVFIFLVQEVVVVILGRFFAYEFMGALAFSWILQGEVWRIVTSSFLHGGILHLAFNMYALWLIGQFVENFFGTKKFLIIYITSLLLGGIGSLLTDLIVVLFASEPAISVSVGASGAIFGLFGVILGTNLQRERFGLQLPIDTNQLILVVALNLFIGFAVPSINNAAHIGGFLGGFILSYIVKPQNYFGSKLSQQVINIAYSSLLAITIISVFAHLIWAVISFTY